MPLKAVRNWLCNTAICNISGKVVVHPIRHGPARHAHIRGSSHRNHIRKDIVRDERASYCNQTPPDNNQEGRAE